MVCADICSPPLLACIRIYRQQCTDVIPLREAEAYPAEPQDAYGWEKLITEQLCTHYRRDYDMHTRIVRFHNIFGPCGTYDGGR